MQDSPMNMDMKVEPLQENPINIEASISQADIDAFNMDLPNLDDIESIEKRMKQQAEMFFATKSPEPLHEENNDEIVEMPDLSINNNFNFSFNESDLTIKSKKKIDKKAELLKSLNLVSSKDNPASEFMGFENAFTQDMLASNMKMMQDSVNEENQMQDAVSIPNSPYMANTNSIVNTVDEEQMKSANDNDAKHNDMQPLDLDFGDIDDMFALGDK